MAYRQTGVVDAALHGACAVGENAALAAPLDRVQILLTAKLAIRRRPSQLLLTGLYVHTQKTLTITTTTRMWANAQRDGRSAEHRWRPLFNAAKFG